MTTESGAPRPTRPSPAGLLLVLLFWAAAGMYGHFANSPPRPVDDSDAAPDAFSAVRAEPILKELVGDGIAHPAGSAQNRVVRDRVIGFLNSFGYETTIQQTEARLAYRRSESDPDVVPLFNILARLEGSDGKTVAGKDNSVMLLAHFDSTPAGPGACDDGVGLSALLEIARLLKSNGFSPARDIIFLITDGEENGLLGAKKFVAEHPWASELEWVINLEARGTTGPSYMFETSGDSLPLVRRFANVVDDPRSSSLYFEVYKYLPNGTDFTIFKDAGINGYNFAFIGDPRKYHTPEDSYEAADRGSLQHHGDNALALLKSIAMEPEIDNSGGNAVYFDLVGLAFFWWPARVSNAVAIGCGMLAIAITFKTGRPKLYLSAIFAVSLAIILPLLAGITIATALSTDARFEPRWLDSPTPVILIYWLAMLATTGLIAGYLLPDLNPVAVWTTSWVTWMLIAIGASFVANGTSHLFVVPVATAWLARLILFDIAKLPFAPVPLFSAAIAGLIWVPLLPPLYDAMGFDLSAIYFGIAALLATTLIPLAYLAGRRVSQQMMWLTLFGVVAMLIVAWLGNPPGAV